MYPTTVQMKRHSPDMTSVTDDFSYEGATHKKAATSMYEQCDGQVHAMLGAARVACGNSLQDILLSEDVASAVASHLRSADDLQNLVSTNPAIRRSLLRSVQSLKLAIRLKSKLVFSPLLTAMPRLTSLVLDYSCNKPPTTIKYMELANDRLFLLRTKPVACMPSLLNELRVIHWRSSFPANVMNEHILAASMPCLTDLRCDNLTIGNAEQIDRSKFPSLTALTASFDISRNADMGSSMTRLFSYKLNWLRRLTLLPSARGPMASSDRTSTVDMSGMTAMTVLHVACDDYLYLSKIPPNLKELYCGPNALNWSAWRKDAATCNQVHTFGIYYGFTQPNSSTFYDLRQVCRRFPNLRRLESPLHPASGGDEGAPTTDVTEKGCHWLLPPLATSEAKLTKLFEACRFLSFIDGDYLTSAPTEIWPLVRAMSNIKVGDARVITLTDRCLDDISWMPFTRELRCDFDHLTYLGDCEALKHVSTFDSSSSTILGFNPSYFSHILPSLTSLVCDVRILHSTSDAFDFSSLPHLAKLDIRFSSCYMLLPGATLSELHDVWRDMTIIRNTLYNLPASLSSLQVYFDSGPHVCAIKPLVPELALKIREASVDLPYLLQRLPALCNLSVLGCGVTGFDDACEPVGNDDEQQCTLKHACLSSVLIQSWRGHGCLCSKSTLSALVRNVSRCARLPSLSTFVVEMIQPFWMRTTLDDASATLKCVPVFPEMHNLAEQDAQFSHWIKLDASDSVNDLGFGESSARLSYTAVP